MPRRHDKGRNIHGWVILDKPGGITSARAVAQVMGSVDARKAGHAGTLDPAATGVLPIALGEATKLIPLISDSTKAYAFTVCLGSATDSDDAEGTVIASSDLRPGTTQIECALSGFVGHIMQVPPQVSAIRVDGKRAYARARAGQQTTLRARPLWVERLHIVARPDRDRVILEMVCGKGGYVRAIARDLGETLGCHAHVGSLRRLRTGPFALDVAVSFAAIVEAPPDMSRITRLVLPPEAGLKDIPQVEVSADHASRLRNGNPVPIQSACGMGDETAAGPVVCGMCRGKVLAIGRVQETCFRPTRVLNL